MSFIKRVQNFEGRAWLGPLFFVICLGLLSIDIFRGFWDHDSGYFFMQSLMISRGLKPFIDFRTLYPPLFSILNAVPLILGADPWFLTWFIPLFWISAIGLLSREVWKAFNPSFRPIFGWIIAGVFPLFCIDFGGNHNTLELGLVFFGLLSILASVRGDFTSFFLAGTCVGCACLVKQMGLLLIVPIITQTRTYRKILMLMGGFLLPVLLCLLWLNFNFRSIGESHRLIQHYMLTNNPFLVWDLPSRFYNMVLSDSMRTPPGVGSFIFIFILTIFALYSSLRQKLSSKSLWIVSWSMIALAYLGARAINNYPHYTLNCWPAWVALISVSAGLVDPLHLKIVLRASLIAVFIFMVVQFPYLRDYQGLPYFERWRDPGMLPNFLKLVGSDLKTILPSSARVTQIGLDENILLFLAGHIPLNRDWSEYDSVSPIVGDSILFVNYGQQTGGVRLKQILAAGYKGSYQWTWGSGKVIYFVAQK